jgi:hypothetical protein
VPKKQASLPMVKNWSPKNGHDEQFFFGMPFAQ